MIKRLLIIPLLLITFSSIAPNRNDGDDVFDEYLFGGFRKFARITSRHESGHRRNVVGRGYYRGEYQFGPTACKDIGISYDSLFVQAYSDSALRLYMHLNWKRLGACPYYDKKGNLRYTKDYYHFIGTSIKGVQVNKAGLLFASHVVGHAHVKQWLNSNGKKNATDANGVSVRDCMLKMKDINLIMY